MRARYGFVDLAPVVREFAFWAKKAGGYDPNQPRDAEGKWAASGGAKLTLAGRLAAAQKQIKQGIAREYDQVAHGFLSSLGVDAGKGKWGTD